MRVTDSMLGNILTQDLQSVQGQLLTQQQQLSSGQRINTPSDSPSGIQEVLQLNHDLSQNTQYQANANDALTWLHTTDTALSNIVQLAQSVRTLAVSASGAMPSSQVTALASQAASVLQNMVDTANTQQGSSYIFAGTAVDSSTPPFSQDSSGNVTYSGNTGSMKMLIGPSAEITTNTAGIALVPLFSAVQQVVTDLKTGTTTSLGQLAGSDLATLDQSLNGVIAAESVAGSSSQEAQNAVSQLSANQNQWRQLKASVLDTNVTSAVVRLQQLQNTYQSALAVGSQLIQPTLAKYL